MWNWETRLGAGWSIACGALLVSFLGARASAMELASSEIAPGAALALPQLHASCGGGDVSPSLVWKGAPATAKSFAVTLFDPDAQGGWWHWLLYDIPANVHALKAGETPPGARLGKNDFGDRAFGGACPPEGSGPHHYQFTIWALGVAALPAGLRTDGADIGAYLASHALAHATLVGVYQR